MPLETALAYLRGTAANHRIPPVVVIFGPHAFMREYVLDSIARKLVADGYQYRSFQIGAGDDYAEVLNELLAPDLFAPQARNCLPHTALTPRSRGNSRRRRRRRCARVGQRR